MKIVIPAYNYLLEEKKIIDGGSVWLYNIAQALNFSLDNDAEMVSLDWNGNADLMIIQSEWAETSAFKNFKGNKVVLCGHFIGGVYPEPSKINADRFVTVWKGEINEAYKNTEFIPHAFNSLMDKGTIHHENVVWCGNTYSLRDESWLKGIELDNIKTHPKELGKHYKGNVCANIHAPCQMGIISEDKSRIADKSGFMLNERFWNVIGSGGILIQEYHPQILEFFKEDEIIMAKTKEEFKEKCRYYLSHRNEGIEFYKRAKEKILKEHTYINRVKSLCE